MKSKNKNTQKGITLVALIITIIILLILAGISIASLTQTGLFGKAQDAKERTIKAQLKEEIEMAIQEIQLDEIPKGKSVTLESLANGQLVAKLTEITAELVTNEIIGEYKDYDYTIDSNFKVEIGGKVGGIKPTGTAEILTTGYIFEGAGTVQIKVTASIAEGTITSIEAPSGATLVTDTSTTEKIYTVKQNETYVFNIVGDSGRKTNVTAKVENILSAPQIKVDEITENGFKISVENNYPDGAITEYKYYVGDKTKSQGTADKSYTVTGLLENTEYSNIKVVAYINESTSKESNSEIVTTLGRLWENADTISSANTDKVLSTTQNTILKDIYENKIVIPAGFKITSDATTVNKGIVIEDATGETTNGNQFVWIPVPEDGKVYTSANKASYVTVKLNRYSFDSNGVATEYSGSYVEEDSTDTANLKNYGNTIAKKINAFKTSVENNKGYYIGRYEARKSSNGTITEVGTDTVWNNITQPNAATVARNMYDDIKPYKSDLMNSYAWDTATLFLQTCGTNSKYSMQTTVNSSLATTGTNDTTKYTGTQDVQCNVYDMASNIYEWTTETSSSSSSPCVGRGCGYGGSGSYYTSSRLNYSTSDGYGGGFRPLLYL